MNDTTRHRVLVPLLMPLTILGGLLLFSGSLSRILLAVEAEISVLVAVLAAGYVLAMGFVVERNPDIGARALAAGLVLGLVGIVGAGAVAASVGIREIHHEEEGHGAEGAVAAGEVAIPDGALVWGADNGLQYTAAPDSGPAGEVTIAIDNSGGLEHNVAFDGIDGGAPIVAATNGVDVATIELPAGTYTYFCTVAGHRAGGMEGEITLS